MVEWSVPTGARPRKRFYAWRNAGVACDLPAEGWNPGRQYLSDGMRSGFRYGRLLLNVKGRRFFAILEQARARGSAPGLRQDGRAAGLAAGGSGFEFRVREPLVYRPVSRCHQERRA